MTAPAFVSSATTTNGSVGISLTAGNDAIIVIYAFGGTAVFNSISNSQGDGSLVDDFVFSQGFGVYRYHNLTVNGSHIFSITWTTAPTTYFLTAIQSSGIVALDSGAGGVAVNSATSATPTTGNLSPGSSGDLMLALASINHTVTAITWGGSYTSIHSTVAGPGLSSAYLQNAPAGSQFAAASGLGASFAWSALLLAYTGSASVAVAPSSGSESVGGNAPTVTPAANTIVTPLVARRREFERRPSGLLVPSRKIFLPSRRAA